ncbi:hypothetical protein BH10BAC2_BH10BAC2_18450 [soil metagenome]
MQTTADEQSKVRAYYENRLATFHDNIGIKKLDDVNTNSFRYEFIHLIKDKLQQKDVIIIEANKSGYRYVIKNYLVYLNNSNDIHVEVYNSYNPLDWQIEKTITYHEKGIDTVLFHHRAKWAKGFNNDDVIISHFINGQIKTSEFFLFGTLSKNGFEKIIGK